jgi:hypothetical protein
MPRAFIQIPLGNIIPPTKHLDSAVNPPSGEAWTGRRMLIYRNRSRAP